MVKAYVRVSTRYQSLENFFSRCFLQIQGYTALVRVQIKEYPAAVRCGNITKERPSLSGHIAFARLLDFYNIGAEVSHQLTAVWGAD